MPIAAIKVLFEYFTGVGNHSIWEVVGAAVEVIKWALEAFKDKQPEVAGLSMTESSEADLQRWTTEVSAGSADVRKQALALPPPWLMLELSKLLIKLLGSK